MVPAESDKSALRDAATIVVVRDASSDPKVLMGQRGAAAAFMPNKFVFPGGAIDPVDDSVSLAEPLSDRTHQALAEESARTPEAIAAAAIRELWEETGQCLGSTVSWPDPPQGWRGYAARGLRPSGAPRRFIFRAVTPVGRPRRFDARFLLADAAALATDPDDFSAAEDELLHLQWVRLAEARTFDLPFITEVVLAQLSAILPNDDQPADVPFFRNDDESHLVTRLGGAHPLDV